MVIKTLTLSQTNCYLLKARDGYLMIDCGNSRDQLAFIKDINRLGVNIKDIRYLLLSHHHNDHSGLLGFLTTHNPQIQVIMHEKCQEHLHSGTHFKHKDEEYSNPLLGLIVGAYSRFNLSWTDYFAPYLPRAADIIIEKDNDDLLPEFGIAGKILLTPGHTEDSISVVVGEAAFVGDAARNMLNFTGTPYLPILIYDLEACYKSWRKLIENGAEVVFPAHGRTFAAAKLKAF